MNCYAQFYGMSVNWDGGHPSAPIEGCGDRAVIILDARETLAGRIDIARRECKARGYVGFDIRRASGFNRPFTTLHRLELV